MSNGAPPDVLSDNLRRLVVLGYITAVAIPPVGFILGIVIAVRRRAAYKHGLAMIAVSIVAAVIWVLLLGSGVLTSTSSDTSY
jgi:ABC-type dipeptide/oligopeptide/nickel transport system permease component